ncbi:MAG: hypothetical protein CMC28_00325 [Flavobacteriaceae bacterium]|nr:hypothetical protein [Flavobacteriaceae bacterium]|tara:strand:- start:2686 stop:3522 length:837 start_codon:yes stop_codon:yes gene_type:complete
MSRPFIKWAGGKYRIAEKLNSFKPKNINTYFEPMVGSGGLFFSNPPKKAYLSDINSKLINTYNVIKNKAYFQELIDELYLFQDITHSKENYLKIREAFNQDDLNSINSAVYFIYLNKMCFNGLYRENSKGHFNVPMGDKREFSVDEENLIKVHNALQNIEIACHSYENIDPKKGDFVYLDPPYIPLDKLSFTQYSKSDFGEKDHRKLAKFCVKLDKRGVNYMISNSNTDMTKDIYVHSEHIQFHEIQVMRTISGSKNNRGMAGELIITNYNEYDGRLF